MTTEIISVGKFQYIHNTSTLKKEKACSSERFVSFYKTALCNNADEHFLLRGNLETYIYFTKRVGYTSYVI
jgi:hypothetical protein